VANQGRLGWTHSDTTTKAGGYANRNAGFIRQPQCGSPACRMNPAFRWWSQDAPGPLRGLNPDTGHRPAIKHHLAINGNQSSLPTIPGGAALAAFVAAAAHPDLGNHHAGFFSEIGAF
jgi:hypothetical protein